MQNLSLTSLADPRGANDGGIAPEDQLIVEMDGFEGPLDLLLALARTRKLDLTQLSMAELAQQYLAFVETAERLKLELAGDYLVMAAWLAFLKSRLLLPKEEQPQDHLDADAMARALAFRLRRLEAMRMVGERLTALPQLGRELFARGAPEPAEIIVEERWQASLHDLVAAYIARRQKRVPAQALVLPQRQVWSIKQARDRLGYWLGCQLAGDWVELDQHLQRWLTTPAERRTALASSLGAVLELAREGQLDVRQPEPFGPILLRRLGKGEVS